MTDDQVMKFLKLGLDNSLVEPRAEPLLYVPSGIYLCGCPWVGDVIPHCCPTHTGAFVIYDFWERRS